MRITETMPGQQVLSGLTSLENTLLQEQQQLASGQTISEPSDNPVGTAQLLTLNQAQAWNTQWSAAANAAQSFMQTADTALNQVLAELQSARTLAIQAKGGGITPSDMQAMSQQVQGIAQSLTNLANTQYGDQYVFAGTAGIAPYNANTGTWNLTMPQPPLTYEVGSQVSIAASVDAYKVFEAPVSSGQPGAVSSVQQLALHLASGSTAGLGQDLTNIGNAISQVTAESSTLGANMQRIQAISSQLSTAQVNLASQKAMVDSTNVPQVMEQLAQNQAVFQAALSVGAKMMLPTLANVLSQIG